MSILAVIAENSRIKAPKKVRSSKWAKVRKEHITINNYCAACGQTTVLEVHHIVPFHNNPELELDPNNLITLCESAKGGVVCHIFFGHLGDYKSYNENVEEDVKIWKEKLETRP